VASACQFQRAGIAKVSRIGTQQELPQGVDPCPPIENGPHVKINLVRSRCIPCGRQGPGCRTRRHLYTVLRALDVSPSLRLPDGVSSRINIPRPNGNDVNSRYFTQQRLLPRACSAPGRSRPDRCGRPAKIRILHNNARRYSSPPTAARDDGIRKEIRLWFGDKTPNIASRDVSIRGRPPVFRNDSSSRAGRLAVLLSTRNETARLWSVRTSTIIDTGPCASAPVNGRHPS